MSANGSIDQSSDEEGGEREKRSSQAKKSKLAVVGVVVCAFIMLRDNSFPI